MLDQKMTIKVDLTISENISTALDKSHYKSFSIHLPTDWTTAPITFLGSRTFDGTYVQVVNPDNSEEAKINEVAASKCISLLEEPSLAVIPYIKLRSGTANTPVDQGTTKTIGISLMR